MKIPVRVAFVWVLFVMGACAGAQVGQQTGTPVPDPFAFVQEVRTGTIPPTPQQITFGWNLDEAGSRVSGRGVVRVEAPERIRLDLFGPRGETYLAAALVDGEYRFPAAAPPPVELPSSSLLWAAMGVFQPPAGATLTGATTEGPTADVRYEAAGGELFVFSLQAGEDGTYRLARLERAGSRGVLETVSLESGPDGSISVARYRDWTAFRDLVLTVESAREENPFPISIWRPGAESR